MRRAIEEEQENKRRSSSSDIPLLSQDLIMEILSRLPIHSLFQCTLVSKSWRDIIIHNPMFSSMQHYRALENQNDSVTLLLCLNEAPNLTSLYLVEPGGVGHCKFTKKYTWFSGLKSHFNRALQRHFITHLLGISIIWGSCNGLLCISNILSNNIYVCNPITRECLMLPSKETLYSRILGFGFHTARNEYKLLRVERDNPNNSRDDYASYKAEIHTLGTSDWRYKEDIPLLYMTFLCDRSIGCSTFLVNDSLHWYHYPHIFSLDMGDEQFGVVATPDSFNDNSPPHSMCLMVWKGLLAAVRRSVADDSLQIWVMMEYNVKESWTKQVNVRWPIWYLYDNVDLPSYIENPKDGLTNHPLFSAASSSEYSFPFEVMPHVGSLLSLKTIAGKEGSKNISFLQIPRFNKTISTNQNLPIVQNFSRPLLNIA